MTLKKFTKKPKAITPNQIVTTEHLQKFKSELLKELLELIQNAPTTPKEWMKTQEVMRLLNISPGKLQHLRVMGTLPFTKIGGTAYYKYDDVMQMLEKYKKK